MNTFSLLQDLAIVMIAVGATAIVCHWLKQPKVIGYIIAGLLIGPHMPIPGMVSSAASIQTLADMGIVFLMFTLGMDFNLRRLTGVGAPAFATACVDIVVTFWLGFMLGRWLGWSGLESIFLGAIICDSSTSVVSRIIHGLGHAKDHYASIIFGATIAEDLIAIILITILTGIGISGTVATGNVLFRLGELVAFLVAILLIGFFLMRPFINLVARLKSDELLLVTALGFCFTVSLVAARLEFSLALGAFIIGAVMAESGAAERIAQLTRPIHDVFAPIFFVSMGMMLDPGQIATHWGAILLISAAVMVGKITGSSLGAFLSGNDRETSFRIGCGMAQICEFALIIAALGQHMGVTKDYVYPIAVSVSVITTFFSPYLLRNADTLHGLLARGMPKAMSGAMAFYTRWIRAALRGRVDDAIRRIVRRSLTTIVVNIALITAVFIAVTLFARVEVRVPVALPESLGGNKTLLWLFGVLVTVPLYVATARKMQALSMLAAEMKFPMDSARPHAAIARTLAEKGIFVAGVALLTIFTLMLTAALMPPLPVLGILLGVVIAITLLLWKFQIRLYARAQNVFIQTFSQPPVPLDVDSGTALPYAFRNAQIQPIPIPADAAPRRSQRQLMLKARSGATIVGIERAGETIVNPNVEEPILPGDTVFVLGTSPQIEQAGKILTASPGHPSTQGPVQP